MTNQHDSFPDMMHEDLGFEVVMRGYSRRQVHDHMTRMRNQIRDLEERLARAIDQAEQGRVELAEARRRLAEAPQDYDEIGERLSAILKLGEEEARAKRQAADDDAAKVREDAAAESERILSAAQAEAERRVHEATTSAERLLAQAGSDAEETLGAARQESEETLRAARAEADRTLTSAQRDAEKLISDANAEAEATLTSARAESEATLKSAKAEAADMLSSAQRRATSLDDHTGRRVTFLTDTHTEVVRRLNEMGTVLTDLLQRENSAGPLIDEASVLPPRPVIGTVDDPGDQDAPVSEKAAKTEEAAAKDGESPETPADAPYDVDDRFGGFTADEPDFGKDASAFGTGEPDHEKDAPAFGKGGTDHGDDSRDFGKDAPSPVDGAPADDTPGVHAARGPFESLDPGDDTRDVRDSLYDSSDSPARARGFFEKPARPADAP
ncbi:hypothetical protein ABGB17_30525 [Sphaerisporangium sp. B11E5]|uniref:hypothetical protein n=1 Tax=Sphaerisporangium sp. B11E5 TaxID=3153563 RepID=UPI00325D70EF